MKKTNEAKETKHQLAVALYGKAAGDKEKPIIIWKTQKPHCFKKVDVIKVGVIRKSHKKASMTFRIMKYNLKY